MPRLLAGNSLGVDAIWQHEAPSVWSRRIANLPLLTCRHGQIPAPDGSSSAQCFAQPSLPPMCRSGAHFSGDINEPCHGRGIRPLSFAIPIPSHSRAMLIPMDERSVKAARRRVALLMLPALIIALLLAILIAMALWTAYHPDI